MANQTGLQFTVKVGALPPETFAVAAFRHQESLSAPFTLRLELASPQPDIDVAAVLDQPCELLVWYDGELQRRVCGVVSEFAQGDSGFRRTRYSLEVKPALWRLGLRQNSRIFQAQKPDEIISILLQEAGITDYAFALKNEHAQREYCVQYRESDLAFVNRLAAEEGLFYFHEFEAGKHRIIFADDAAAVTQGPELFFNLGNRSLEQGPYVRQFHYREAVRPSDVELKDYSFKTPAYALSHKKAGSELDHQRDSYQHFDYPGRFKEDPSGKAFVQHRLDALRNDAVSGSGKSNSAALLPGQFFSLTEHPNASLNSDWQIVHISHTGEQPQALEEEGGSGPTVYHNEFGVVKASTTWRPQIPHKPMVDGPHIATVVGPEGEEIYCDEHGRVKLQFPWDRYGESNDQSSCWVRVSQGWAGGQYGMMAIPRIGHEVIVSFLEGDPDQPIITGRTYHATNRPPYPLPANKTRTVLRTETHQGEGFNELRFEDQAGQEEIYIHGQKDLNALIENDVAWHIKHDEHRDIDNERVTRIKANDHLTVEGEKRDQIKADYSLTVDSSMHQKLGQSWLTQVGQEMHVKSGAKVVLEAGSEITVKVGGCFIKVDAGGVTLLGPTIKMNSGGSPGSGCGWGGKAPGLPKGVAKPDAPPAQIEGPVSTKSMDSLAPLSVTASPSDKAVAKKPPTQVMGGNDSITSGNTASTISNQAAVSVDRWKIPPAGAGLPLPINTSGPVEKKVVAVSYLPVAQALNDAGETFMTGSMLDNGMLSRRDDKLMFSIARNTLVDDSVVYTLELAHQRERPGAGIRNHAEYAYWAPQGGFVDIPLHPENGEPHYVFTPDFSGCCIVVDRLDESTLRVRHVEGGKEKAQYNDLPAADVGEGMVGCMLYDDYGIHDGKENRCGFAYMAYRESQWVIKWQSNVGTLKLVNKKTGGYFSKTKESEYALVSIPPEVFASGARDVNV